MSDTSSNWSASEQSIMDNLEPLATDGGQVVKTEMDYSTMCDEKITIAESLASEDKLQEAIDELLVLEKLTRTGSDLVSTSRILITIVQMCFNSEEWTLLNEYLVILTKRRSQLKLSVAAMVKECCTYIDLIPDKETKLNLIGSLRNITEGKIYVEVDRARLTQKLAQIMEDDGDITSAAKIIQELQVETYGTMKKQEKIELILEQMRLCLAVKDYICTQIISKKINTNFFNSEKLEIQQLKLKYFKLMIELCEHNDQYLDICSHYRAIQATPEIDADKRSRDTALQNAILYLILAPYDNHQVDLKHRILEEEVLEEIPKYKSFLQLFITVELIKWKDLTKDYEHELKYGTLATNVFSNETEEGIKHWTQLKTRVSEHNIRVLATYYSRIKIKRMAELLDMTVEDTEELLSNMIVEKYVTAKIDRPAGIVDFSVVRSSNEILNDWSFGLNNLMKLMNNTTHLINKEEMVHNNLMSNNK